MMLGTVLLLLTCWLPILAIGFALRHFRIGRRQPSKRIHGVAQLVEDLKTGNYVRFAATLGMVVFLVVLLKFLNPS